MNVQEIKKDFPIFTHHPDLVYVDSAASSLTPKCVIEKTAEYYEQYGVNISRGVYHISEKATEEYEETRDVVARFINAAREEVIFTSGTTAAINLVAQSFGKSVFSHDDTIVMTAMDHHASFVPLQMLAKEKNVQLHILPIDENGLLKRDCFNHMVTKHTKVLALPYVSNVLGTINPIKELVKHARDINADIVVLVDAAQAVPSRKIDVRDLGCDFLVFSAHKMCGPTGVGVLWGKKEFLEKMPPVQFGGEMVQMVSAQETTFRKTPHKFEAGTPNIAGVIAFKEAIAYLQKIGLENISAHEQKLLHYAVEKFERIFGNDLTLYGPKNLQKRGNIMSFTFKKHHPHDIAQIIDERKNVCVRAGQHCAMPLHNDYLHIPATCRASFYIYNDRSDIDLLVEGLQEVDSILSQR